MSEKNELLPCPFCGAKDDEITVQRALPDYWVECLACGIRTNSCGDSEIVVRRWNRRAPQAQGAGRMVSEYERWGVKEGLEVVLQCAIRDLDTIYEKLDGGLMSEPIREVGILRKTLVEKLNNLRAIAKEPEVQSALQGQQRDLTPEEALAEARKRWGNQVEVILPGIHYIKDGALTRLEGKTYREIFESNINRS